MNEQISVRADDPRLYVRLAVMVRDQIIGGALKPGSLVPSISRLTREQGVSRQTVGKALRMLELEGLVQRVPGLGYYVKE
jgi:GntR family transcriptional regulator